MELASVTWSQEYYEDGRMNIPEASTQVLMNHGSANAES
jgi:hypothetical protein